MKQVANLPRGCLHAAAPDRTHVVMPLLGSSRKDCVLRVCLQRGIIVVGRMFGPHLSGTNLVLRAVLKNNVFLGFVFQASK